MNASFQRVTLAAAAALLLAPNLVAVMTLAPSMTADMCDPEEVTMRVRREVLFSAVLGWMLKVALPSSIFLAGVALALTGGQTALKEVQPTETLQAMRIAFSAARLSWPSWRQSSSPDTASPSRVSRRPGPRCGVGGPEASAQMPPCSPRANRQTQNLVQLHSRC